MVTKPFFQKVEASLQWKQSWNEPSRASQGIHGRKRNQSNDPPAVITAVAQTLHTVKALLDAEIQWLISLPSISVTYWTLKQSSPLVLLAFLSLPSGPCWCVSTAMSLQSLLELVAQGIYVYIYCPSACSYVGASVELRASSRPSLVSVYLSWHILTSQESLQNVQEWVAADYLASSDHINVLHRAESRVKTCPSPYFPPTSRPGWAFHSIDWKPNGGVFSHAVCSASCCGLQSLPKLHLIRILQPLPWISSLNACLNCSRLF